MMCVFCNISVEACTEIQPSKNNKLAGESLYLIREKQGYVLVHEGMSFDIKFCPMCGRKLEKVE